MAREKICGIYCIRNLENEKCYVGQSVDIYKRWSQHRLELNKHKHYNVALQADWDKYGSEAFDFKIVEACNESKLDLSVRLCCKGKRPHHKGFIWRYEGNQFDKYKIPNLEYKKVCKLNFDGNILAIFENRADAASDISANTSEIDRSARTGSICRGFL